MQVTLGLTAALLAIIISQSLFAGVLLFFSKDNRPSNRLLGLLIFALALWLTDHFLRIAGIYRQNPRLYFMPIFYSLGFGPLIWFYVRSLVNAAFRFQLKHLLHFLPLMVQAALYWVLTFTSYQTKYWFWEEVHRPFTYRLEFDLTWLSLMVYSALAFRLVRKYQHWLTENYSESSRIRLNWLKVILAALLIICGQWLVEIILRDGMGIYFRYDYTVQLLGVLLLILAVAGFRQTSLAGITYQPRPAEAEPAAFQSDELVLQKLRQAMEQDQLYLNPTLSLTELANALQLPARTISRHINAGFNCSFNDYVNGYRVAEVQRRLRAGELQKVTMLAIAYDSGFNSKTTFNRIFKETAGVPPSDFL